MVSLSPDPLPLTPLPGPLLDHIYESLRSSPGWMAVSIRRAISARRMSVWATVIALALLPFGAIVVWRLRSRLKPRRESAGYTRLRGDARARLLNTYKDAERLLGRAGLGPRSESQTVGEYVAPAGAMPDETWASLAWLRAEAWRAAYDPRPYDSRLLPRARQHLRQLKSALKAHHRLFQEGLAGR